MKIKDEAHSIGCGGAEATWFREKEEAAVGQEGERGLLEKIL